MSPGFPDDPTVSVPAGDATPRCRKWRNLERDDLVY